MAPVVPQGKLNDLMEKHSDRIMDMGKYEQVGRSMAARSDGLAYFYMLLIELFTFCPWCEVNYSQWKEAIVHAEAASKKEGKDLNSGTFNLKIWSGQRAERFMTVLYHVRRLKRTEEAWHVFAKKASKADLAKVQATKLH